MATLHILIATNRASQPTAAAPPARPPLHWAPADRRGNRPPGRAAHRGGRRYLGSGHGDVLQQGHYPAPAGACGGCERWASALAQPHVRPRMTETLSL